MSEVDESELICQAQAGNEEAFGEIVRRYQGRLRGYAARYVGNAHDAFELVQDAFINAYQNLERFDATRVFYPWLRTICHNLVLNWFRSRRTRRNINLELVDYAICEKVADEQEEQNAAEEERIKALQLCIQRLSTAHQQLILERYHHAVPVKDIAAEENATATSVSMRLSRVRDKLRKCMLRRMEKNAI